jgi:hypothetical protein
MAVKSGTTITEAFDGLKGEFLRWRRKDSIVTGALGGADAAADLFATSLWHDARRTKDAVAAIQAAVQAMTGGATALRDHAEAQYSASYDIMAETLAFVAALSALQSAIETMVGGLDVDGYIQDPYIRLADTGPFFKQYTAAEYSSVKTQLQAVVNGIG